MAPDSGSVGGREAEVRRLLANVYLPEGVDIWLNGRNRSLGDKRPIELLVDDKGYRTVLLAIERLEAGAM